MMHWKNLLSQTRVRELFEGDPSQRVPGDIRSPFDQDYGRAVFATPTRRLQDKAQVFPLEPHDAVRTRLTHSLEVSSIARGLGEKAERFIREERGDHSAILGAIPVIAATCALIHDIGNPPFGHAGESAIAEWFANRKKLFASFPGCCEEQRLSSQAAQDFLKFEGNAQTQRLLSSLQMLTDRYGLNLTSGTLSASLKYTVPSNRIASDNAGAKKHGYFASENELVYRVKQEVGTGDARNPITFLVEAADDIAYATVDLEDGIKKKCLDWDTVERHLRSDAAGKATDDILWLAHEKIDPANLVGTQRDEALSIGFRTYASIVLTNAAMESFIRNYDLIMAGRYSQSLLKDSNASEVLSCLKWIGRRYVYSSQQTLKLELMGRRVISDLLTLFWDGAKYVGKSENLPPFSERALSLISHNYRSVCEDNIKGVLGGLPPDYFRMQLATDWVCGMTDTFAVTLHKELFNG
jgi:dGTPase